MTSSAKDAKEISTILIIAIVAITGGGALGIIVSDWIHDSNAFLFPPSKEEQDRIDFPNPHAFQYLLPDIDRVTQDGDTIDYNVAVDMHAKSFSAHQPIRVNTEISFVKESMPKNYFIPETMYVVFVGSHNIPIKLTGLGEGHYFGYIEANMTGETEYVFRYNGTAIIQYEMAGEYPVYVSSIRPYIDKVKEYNANIALDSPIITIGSEADSNAVKEAEEAAKRERFNEAATLAILAVSFAAVRPAVNEIIDDYFNRKFVGKK